MYTSNGRRVDNADSGHESNSAAECMFLGKPSNRVTRSGIWVHPTGILEHLVYEWHVSLRYLHSEHSGVAAIPEGSDVDNRNFCGIGRHHIYRTGS
jgi:hypothetical protein